VHCIRVRVIIAIEVRAPGEAEVDQERTAERATIVDHDVGRLHVAVQDAVLVHVLQRGQDVPADSERVGHRERTGLKTLGEREALDQRRDQIELAGFAPDVDQRREPGARDLAQDERFVHEPLANARCDLSERGRLDDDPPAGLDVVGEPCVDAQTRLQLAYRPESPRECGAAVLPVCHRFVRDVSGSRATAMPRAHRFQNRRQVVVGNRVGSCPRARQISGRATRKSLNDRPDRRWPGVSRCSAG
jgi:hypothetical protein